MNTVPEPSKKVKLKKVVSDACLPSRGPMVSFALLYHLYDLQYDWPMWIDFTIYGVLIVWALVIFAAKIVEVPVDIFKE